MGEVGEGRGRTGLVGRNDELADIRRTLDEVDAGSSRLLVVSGEAGIGKTRILTEIAALAAPRGHTVLRGSGTELEGEMSFGALVEAIDDVLTSLGPGNLGSLCAQFPLLADVFPAFSSRPGPPSVPATERYRHHRAIRALLEDMAQLRPLTLMVDDIHWADAASVEAVAHLARHALRARVLLVLAHRKGQLPPILANPIGGAEREGRAQQMVLPTLTEDGAAPLLAAEPSRERRRRIYVESGGNPFFIEELLRAPASPEQRAAVPRIPHDSPQIPSRVAAAINEELRRMPDDPRRMLEGAAVVGEPFEPEFAAEAASVPGDVALELLDDLVARDWIRSGAAPRLFRFRHPIVRRAIYDAITPGRRIALHRRAADALASRGAPPAARAHHVANAARVGDAGAITTLMDAASSVSATSPGAAAQWLASAMSLVPAGDVGGRFTILGPLALAQAASGAMDDACKTLAEITETLPPETGTLWAQAVATLATLELYLGRHRRAGSRLEAALGSVPADSDSAVPLLVVLAIDAAYRGERRLSTEWGAQALERSATARDPALRASALSAQTLVLELSGAINEAVECRIAAAAAADALTNNQLATSLETLYHLGAAEMFLERFADGVRHLERGVAIAMECGNVQTVMPTRTFLAYGLWRLGQLDEAIAVASEAVETGRLLRMPAATAWALAISASVWSAVDVAEALRLAGESIDLLEGVEDEMTFFGSHGLVAGVCSNAGEHERCLSEVELAGAPDFEHLEVSANCHLSEAVTSSLVALGRIDEAHTWAARGEAFAAGSGLRVAEAATVRARALVLLAESEPKSAGELALIAAQQAAAHHAPIEAGRSRIVAGRALAAADERGRAVQELRQARLELARCGARRFENEAARALRALGDAAPAPVARRSGDIGTRALSGREREIARLVAFGRTNPEIAQALFLSPKTVEGHMRRIFRKLDVTSRAQVAAAVAREESAS